jgi:hypothetical protein
LQRPEGLDGSLSRKVYDRNVITSYPVHKSCSKRVWDLIVHELDPHSGGASLFDELAHTLVCSSLQSPF